MPLSSDGPLIVRHSRAHLVSWLHRLDSAIREWRSMEELQQERERVRFLLGMEPVSRFGEDDE